MKRLTVFKKLVTAATVSLTLTACPPPRSPENPVEFSGKDSKGNTADFIMAVSPNDTSTKLSSAKLSKQFQSDPAIQNMLEKANKIVFVGAEGCDGSRNDEDNAGQIRRSLTKQLSRSINPQYQELSENFDRLKQFEKCPQKNISTKYPRRIIIIGLTRNSPIFNPIEAIKNGLENAKLKDLRLENYALFELIYRQPLKDNKKWQSKLIQGNDKNGNTVIFDVNFVTSGYWESGKDNKIVYAGESGGLDKLETQEINEKLAVADEVISVGAADCQGEDQSKQEALSRDRASNLQDKLRIIKIVNRERYPNYRRLILGQYLTKYCKDYK
ncbi:hypothetical protein H6S82_21850 [Planktothrix sp. FACHB-1355]|uniref:Uncharacterized protein n=1 Tax=Aerosakkonema funiforme FACHB-1375 TaxID=2949571 RepID=A0A926VMF7_9CYAN|nr:MULTISPECIES: hypothetical protein [Oscillatoriales]MBD2185189.1 hypothetical protein [Aerosakkonema funiforme FACHB-1375]MBD3561464.1 hypothetical protein [Planktothrix sp. FACHB-1355]